MELLLAFLRQAAALAALATVSGLLGDRVLRSCGWTWRSPPERWAFATGAGLGLLGTLLLALAACNGFTAPAIAALALMAVAAAQLSSRWIAPRAGSRAPSPRVPQGGTISRVMALTSLVALLPTFLLSLYPPTAFDATTYHLPYAAAFVRSHGLVVIPEHLFPVFPQLLELLFAGLLATAGEIATNSVQMLAFLVTTATLFAAGERFGGRRAGLLAAAIWIGNPLVHYQAASAYIDLGLVLFVLLAIVSWEIWHAGGRRHWLLASGAFAGLAAATKHLGLIWLALLALTTLVARDASERPRRLRWAAAAAFALAALAALAPFSLRLVVETGNPLFPFLSDWFPTSGSPLEQAVGMPLADAWRGDTAWFADRWLAFWQAPTTFLALPWRAVFDRAEFDFQAPLSPIYLLLLPLLAWRAWSDRRFRRWLAWVVAYALAGTLTDPRFQLPSAALVALAGGLILVPLGDRAAATCGAAETRRRAALALFAFALALPGPVYAAYRLSVQGRIPSGDGERESYLARALPSYPAVARLNRICGSSYSLATLGAENLAYFARGRFVGHRGGPYSHRRLAVASDAERLASTLAAWRVDALLVTSPVAASLPSFVDPALAASFRTLEQSPHYRLVAPVDRFGHLRLSCLQDFSGNGG